MQNPVVFWLRQHLFSSVAQSVLTLLLLTVLALVGSTILRWGVIDAIGFNGTAEQCRAVAGACWAVIGEKYRPILFGLYPYDEQWRAALAVPLAFGSERARRQSAGQCRHRPRLQWH